MWLASAKKRPSARIRLFCFPHAGAGISAYSGWADALDPEIELHTVQLPGRESRFREPNCETMADLLTPVVAAVAPYVAEPFALFGNSFGGVLAYETARELNAKTGRTPAHLFLSACAAPHLPNRHEPIAHLPDERLLPELASRYDGIPDAILQDREFLQAILPPIRADLSALEQYCHRWSEPMSCPVTVFGGQRDPTVSYEQLAAWQAQTTGPFQLHMLEDEGHLYLRSARSFLTRTIRQTLGP